MGQSGGWQMGEPRHALFGAEGPSFRVALSRVAFGMARGATPSTCVPALFQQTASGGLHRCQSMDGYDIHDPEGRGFRIGHPRAGAETVGAARRVAR